MEKATEVQSAFFPAMAKLVKSTKPQADLEKAFLEQAKKLNDHLESEKTKYFAGDVPTLIDFSLAPKLYRAVGNISRKWRKFQLDLYQETKLTYI